MVDLSDLGLLSLIEGVADILPIDASAPSFLASRLLGWRGNPLLPSLHLGAALAVMSYFARDVALIARGLTKLPKARIEPGTRLLAKLLMTAAPLMLASWLGVQMLRITSLLGLGLITLAGALAMLLADRLSMTVKRTDHIGVGTTVALGLLQLPSLISGVGRVAIGLTAARLFAMERLDACRFIVLASVPVLLAQSAMLFLQHAERRQPVGMVDLMAGLICYALVLLALPLAFAVIRSAGLMPFILYRLLFGLALVGLGLL